MAPATLGFSSTDFAVTHQIADFFRQLMPKDADKMFSLGTGGDNGEGFSGIPVRRVDFTAAGQTTTEITDISRQSFADATFEVPAGFKKEALGLGPGR